MARRPPNNVKTAAAQPTWSSPFWVIRQLAKALVKLLSAVFLVIVFTVVALKWINPPTTYLMMATWLDYGEVDYRWLDLDDMSPNIPLAVAAAEDANFCAHNGFDFEAIEAALDEDSGRGASTISQQVAKNVFLWPSRSWARKGLEVGFTVLIEAIWGKRRIMEVYLNVAETGTATFGVDAAIYRHFNGNALNLSLNDAARIAVALPNPQERNISRLSNQLKRRASRIAIGGSTLREEGRADCFLNQPSP